MARSAPEFVCLPIKTTTYFVTNMQRRWDNLTKNEGSVNLRKSLDELLVLLGKRLEKLAPIASLKKSLEHRISQELCAQFRKSESKDVFSVHCSMRLASFELVIDKLHDKGLITVKAAPREAKPKCPHWLITTAGAKRLSHLRANGALQSR